MISGRTKSGDYSIHLHTSTIRVVNYHLQFKPQGSVFFLDSVGTKVYVIQTRVSVRFINPYDLHPASIIQFTCRHIVLKMLQIEYPKRYSD